MEKLTRNVSTLINHLYSLVREFLEIQSKRLNTLFGSREGGMSSYLGIPVDISGSKCKMFAFLKDMLQNRVNRWSAQWLSK